MTPGFLSAHGYDPGPTQRPVLGGAMSGIFATIPAVAMLVMFGSLHVVAQILGISSLAAIAAGWFAMAAAGAVYARIFGRAANDVRGGWLFGMVFGFALWAAGAVMVLPIVGAGQTPAGRSAIGILLSFIAWGAALGIVHPFVHRLLHERLETAAKRMGPHIGTGRPRS